VATEETETKSLEFEKEMDRRLLTDDDLPVKTPELMIEKRHSLRAMRTRMTGVFLNTMMGDTLMGGDDDLVEDMTDSDEDFFKEDFKEDEATKKDNRPV